MVSTRINAHQHREDNFEHIASLGYRIHIEADNAAAIHEKTGQVYRATFDDGDR